MKKEISTAPPAHVPLVQTNKERLSDLNDWEKLLGNLPNCNLEKSHRGLIESGGSFINDNADIFESATFVLSTHANLDSYSEAVFWMYFLFHDDMSFSIFIDQNANELDVRTPDVLAFNNHCKDRADNWIAGYEKIVEILEEAFPVNQIPAPPAF
jgi:hypothetical protein